ncbi:MAG: segregation/condensation protein A [Betaproteobacteria bacterium]|nr:segregation/condensation protein A [Betaproteobacteria bacterium]
MSQQPPAGDAGSPEQLELRIVARLYGAPLESLPQDLFIPPDALEIYLESFEGPLDLLLYLIRKQNFNIFDIPMAEVTRQYLAYIEQIRERDLELASDYLLMAALLIDIKSRMLLPVKRADGEEEAADPRAELARRLIEYENMKLAAQRLEALPQVGRDFLPAAAIAQTGGVVQLPEVSLDDLRHAWADILRRASLVQHHRISREELSVRDFMTRILRNLHNRRFAEFEDLFEIEQGTQTVVVTFIALLELARESLVEITQAEAFAPIYVRLAYQPS